MNTELYWVLFSCIFLLVIGGINWLTTGIRNFTENTETDNDLLSLIPGSDSDPGNLIKNIVYILVGVAAIGIVLIFLNDKFKSNKIPTTAFGF
jgi:uncharacterized membrane protein YuzA (DUF378 family)